LVVSVARKHLPARTHPNQCLTALMDLVSDGNMVLMRTVDSFDIHLGNRFSTYVTFSLMREFARDRADRRTWASNQLAVDLADSRAESASEDVARRDEVGKLLARLEPREQEILAAHFGLRGRGAGMTYVNVGRELGLSKERVRVIEMRALEKLRAGEMGTSVDGEEKAV
jgi:RNA polymerase primary sigma factor/RNA polymerase sigma factor